jgi:methylated-DNA-[protein]-cysteine S-methyltransferase
LKDQKHNPLSVEFRGFLLSPLGILEIISNDSFIISLLFRDDIEVIPDFNENQIVHNCIVQLMEYFEGKRFIFDLALNPAGTDFQKKVWSKVFGINFGEVVSYGDISKTLGNPKLTRAVGLANGANPITIIIPCHRVIGSNGTLTGYSGGLNRKKWLLNHEQKYYSRTTGQLKLF